MLQSAGYTNGLQVTLITKNDQGEPAMAQALKELAEPAGFIIRVNILEPERYWEQWTDIDLGITSWGHRPLATMTLALGYSALEDGTPSSWNETHWVDEEFNELLREAEKTLDTDERRAIMCKISAVMGDRGPIGISYWSKAWTIVRDEFQHIRPMPSNYDLLYDVWKQTI
ncbi:MAG: hypothetical protein HC837_14325 [Chloroflexaceae bacterium]|nr:hypothetical protein [Chloroflexaceae bacterium]